MYKRQLHAIGVANNLLAAMVDNHIFQGNEKHIKRVTWKRCMDMNDRQLRVIQSCLLYTSIYRFTRNSMLDYSYIGCQTR